MTALNPSSQRITLRHYLHPGDIGRIVLMHGTLYAKEYGFDETFEAYVAYRLGEFVRSGAKDGRIWIAEQNDQLVGCIAIVANSPVEAQLLWFLIDPAARGQGLGRRLLGEAIDYCKSRNFRSIFLWTVSALTTAGRLYRDAGFKLVEQKPSRPWAADVVEERYVLNLPGSP